MKKITLKQYIVLFIGSLIIGFGIGACNYAALGVDPMSVLVTGLLRFLPFTFGIVNLLVTLSQLILGFVIERKNITLATFVSTFAVSMGIDAFGFMGLQPTGLPFNVVFLLMGFILYCFGIALTQIPRCGYSAYDCAIFGLMKVFKTEYHVIRWGFDLSYLVVGILLGGQLGINTVLVLLFAGKTVEFFVSKLESKMKF